MEDDAALLARVREHDREALELLLARHAGTVLRFARGMCSNNVDADDVAQETLITAARGLADLKSDKALRPWLYQVARSFCIKQRRRGPHAPTAFVVDHELVGPSAPDREAEGREIAGALTAAIHGLDPRYREVLLLRDVEGLSAPEVADVLGLHLDTVKTRLHRARAQVRERVTPAVSAGGRPPSCPDVVDRFSRFLEGDIGAPECDALHAHVETCPMCNAACASLRRTVALCRTSGDAVPDDVSARVRAALNVVVGRAAKNS